MERDAPVSISTRTGWPLTAPCSMARLRTTSTLRSPAWYMTHFLGGGASAASARPPATNANPAATAAAAR